MERKHMLPRNGFRSARSKSCLAPRHGQLQALDKRGFPYLMLASLSDVTSFRFGTGMHYKTVLAMPGKPIRLLDRGHISAEGSTLTVREKEIISQLAEGHDTHAIAERLFISEGTVRTHRKNILLKTGAKNAVHLVRLAVANGWI